MGALVVLVAVQLSAPGSYLPPVLRPITPPPHHPTQSFHCQSKLPCERLGQRAHWWCWWLSNYRCWDCISRPCSYSRGRSSAPDDHFTAGPHCRVIGSGIGRAHHTGSSPGVIDAPIRDRNFRKTIGSVVQIRGIDAVVGRGSRARLRTSFPPQAIRLPLHFDQQPAAPLTPAWPGIQR